jgi:hypothetical protein
VVRGEWSRGAGVWLATRVLDFGAACLPSLPRRLAHVSVGHARDASRSFESASRALILKSH